MLCVVFSMLYDDVVDCHRTHRLHMIRILYLVNMYLFIKLCANVCRKCESKKSLVNFAHSCFFTCV